MEALTDRKRKPRFTPCPSGNVLALTPIRLSILVWLERMELLSLPQMARLIDRSEQSTRRHVRTLFDAGLLQVLPVSRAALALPDAVNDASLLFGSAPGIFTLTKEGQKTLAAAGLRETTASPKVYGPRNTLFLSHLLMVADFRVWLEQNCRKFPSSRVISWRDGPEANVDLKRQTQPIAVHPDAWWTLGIEDRILVGFLEADRSTERGGLAWRRKIAGYGLLLGSPLLKEVTGYAKARLIVTTPSPKRRQLLAEFIDKEAPVALASRTWLTDAVSMNTLGFDASIWQQPGSQILRPFLPSP